MFDRALDRALDMVPFLEQKNILVLSSVLKKYTKQFSLLKSFLYSLATERSQYLRNAPQVFSKFFAATSSC